MRYVISTPSYARFALSDVHAGESRKELQVGSQNVLAVVNVTFAVGMTRCAVCAYRDLGQLLKRRGYFELGQLVVNGEV